MIHREGYRLLSPNPASIAGRLAVTFQIPPGGDLASVLAPEAPACNRTALRYWVRRQLAEIASDPVDNLMVALEQRLLETLQETFPGACGELDVPSAAAMASSLPQPAWEPTDSCMPPKNRRSRSIPQRSRPSPISEFQQCMANPKEGSHEN